MNNFLHSLPDAETIRYWRMTALITPRPHSEVGLREIIESVLIHERAFKTQGNVSFNTNGLNEVRVELNAYCLKFQSSNPQETSTRTSWGNHLGLWSSLCDVFGHQQRMSIVFEGNADVQHGNHRFFVDGAGDLTSTLEFGDGGI